MEGEPNHEGSERLAFRYQDAPGSRQVHGLLWKVRVVHPHAPSNLEKPSKPLTVASAKARVIDRASITRLGVREDIGVGPSRKIECCSRGQELKASLRDFFAAFTNQKRVETLSQRMKMENVRSGVRKLFLRQLLRTPIRGLLLLGHIGTKELLAKVFQPMLIGVSSHQLRRDLGTVHGPAGHTQVPLQYRQVDARIMKDLHNGIITQQFSQVRGVEVIRLKLDEVANTITRGELQEAKAIAAKNQAHGLTVDSHGIAEIETVGQIALVKMYVRLFQDPLHRSFQGDSGRAPPTQDR